MATVTRTFELSEEAAAELDRRALVAHCGPAQVLDFLLLDDDVREDDFSPEQWADIQEGFRQADAGEFASKAEVDAVFAKYRRQA